MKKHFAKTRGIFWLTSVFLVAIFFGGCEEQTIGDCGDISNGENDTRVRYERFEVGPDETCVQETQTILCENGELGEWTGTYNFENCKVQEERDCGNVLSGESETRVMYEKEKVDSTSVCKKEVQSRVCIDGSFEEWDGDYVFETCEVEGQASCDNSPHGEKESRKRYKAPSVVEGGICTSETQTRTCNNGKWSEWSGSYVNTSCEIISDEKSASCDSFSNGESETRKRYKESSVNSGESCKKETQTRTCNNGIWSGWSGSYIYSSCEVKDKDSCGDSPHGDQESRTYYKEDRVAYGELCESENQTKVCNDGIWSDWSGNYAYSSCVEDGPLDCDGSVHGSIESRIRYQSLSVDSTDDCVSETQTRTCNNGIWSDWNGSYTNESCSVEQAGDDVRAVNMVDCDGTPHGGSEARTMYQSATVQYGDTCVPETQTRICDNGTWSDWSGSYANESCSVDGPQNCGNTLHGNMDSRIRYEKSSVAAGQTCVSETQTRVCNNGIWSGWNGSYTNNTCLVDGAVENCGELNSRVRYKKSLVNYGEDCIFEIQTEICKNGQVTGYTGSYEHDSCMEGSPVDCDGTPHGGSEARTMYQSATVQYGDTCAPETQTRTCNNGIWSDWSGSYVNESCSVESAPANCGDGQTESRTMYESSSVAYGESCISEVQTRTCNNGQFGGWTGSYLHSDCNVEEPANCGSTIHGGSKTRTMYQSASVSSGQTCVSETQTNTCNNGIWSGWSGSYTNENCEAVNSSGGDDSDGSYNLREGEVNDYKIKGINPDVVWAPSSTGGNNPPVVNFNSSHQDSVINEMLGNGVGNVTVNFGWFENEPSVVTASSQAGCPSDRFYYEGRCYKSTRDYQIKKWSDAGVRVIAIIQGVPHWAWKNGCVINSSYCAPNNPDDYARYAGFIANLYNGENGHGKISDFVIHNEVNARVWFDSGCGATCQGQEDQWVDQWVTEYAKSFNKAYDKITKQEGRDARVMISLDNHFDIGEGVIQTDVGPVISGKYFLEKFSNKVGNRKWSVAYHPYPKPWCPQFSVNDAIESNKYGTFGSIGHVVGWLCARFGENSRACTDIKLTEQGLHTNTGPGCSDHCSSSATESDQSKLLCDSFRNIIGTPGINAYAYHRRIDFGDWGVIKKGGEGGLCFGFFKRDGEPKQSWSIWANANKSDNYQCGFQNLPYTRLVVGKNSSGAHVASTRILPAGYMPEEEFYLYRRDPGNAKMLYECWSGSDSFVSTDVRCENGNDNNFPIAPMGPLGYIFNSDDGNRKPLYRCINSAGTDHTVATDCASKSGYSAEGEILGYVDNVSFATAGPTAGSIETPGGTNPGTDPGTDPGGESSTPILIRSTASGSAYHWATAPERAKGNREMEFNLESTQLAGTKALNECSNGLYHFASSDPNNICEGNQKISTIGYIYESSAEGRIPVYRCYNGGTGGESDHLVTYHENCEAYPDDSSHKTLLGYAFSAFSYDANGNKIEVGLSSSEPPEPSGTPEIVRSVAKDGHHWATIPERVPSGNLEEQRYQISATNENGTIPLYECTNGMYNFISASSNCEGAGSLVGTMGYIYSSGGNGRSPIYRCYNGGAGAGSDHLITNDSSCENYPYNDGIIGYAKLISGGNTGNANNGSAPSSPSYTTITRASDSNGHLLTASDSVGGAVKEQDYKIFSNNPAGSVVLYECKMGSDNFTSTSSNCEGQQVIRKLGYISQASTGDMTSPLYRCYNGSSDHLVSVNSDCEGYTKEQKLGYVQVTKTYPPPSTSLTCDGVNNGGTQARTMYKDATVPHGSSCVSESQTRTCNNGTWSNWSGSYTNPDCNVGSAPPQSQTVSLYRSYSNGHHWVADWAYATVEQEYKILKNYEAGTVGLYICSNGIYQFASTNEGCEGASRVSKVGFVYNSGGGGRVPIYRCYNGGAGADSDHLITDNSGCEGYPHNDGIIGYAVKKVK